MLAVFFSIAHGKGLKFYALPQIGAYSWLIEGFDRECSENKVKNSRFKI